VQPPRGAAESPSPSGRGLLWSQLQEGTSPSPGGHTLSPSPSISPGGGLFDSLLASVTAGGVAPMWAQRQPQQSQQPHAAAQAQSRAGQQLSASLPASAFFEAARGGLGTPSARGGGCDVGGADGDEGGGGRGERRVRGGSGALLALGVADAAGSSGGSGVSPCYGSAGASLRPSSSGPLLSGLGGSSGRLSGGLPPISRPPRNSSSSGGSGGGGSPGHGSAGRGGGRGPGGLRHSKSCISFSQASALSPSPSEPVNVFATAFAAASSLEQRQRVADLRRQAAIAAAAAAGAAAAGATTAATTPGAPGSAISGSGRRGAGPRDQAEVARGGGATRRLGGASRADAALRPVRSAPPGSWSGLLASSLVGDAEFGSIPEEPLAPPPAAQLGAAVRLRRGCGDGGAAGDAVARQAVAAEAPTSGAALQSGCIASAGRPQQPAAVRSGGGGGAAASTAASSPRLFEFEFDFDGLCILGEAPSAQSAAALLRAMEGGKHP
jgi:hypothetical protein